MAPRLATATHGDAMDDDDLEANIQRAMPSALKMALYAAKKQNLEVLKYTIEGVDSLCNSAALLKDFDLGNTDADNDHRNVLDDTTKQFAVLETQIAHYKQALETMERLVESGTIDPNAIEQMIDDSLDEPVLNVTRHEFYRRFCDRAGIELEHDGDDDDDVTVQESESMRSTICPVTQLEIDTPLRNPACGHTYSEQGIRSHLQRNTTCPVAGCPQRLTFSNLERDVEMEVLIARKSGAHHQQQQQHQSSMHAAPSAQCYSDNASDDEEYVVE